MKIHLPSKRPGLLARLASMTSALAACLLFASESAHAAAIGVTDNGTTIVVDTHAGLVYTVQKASGDVTSIQWNGTELNDQAKASQIGSGLGSATVTWNTSPPSGALATGTAHRWSS